MRQKFALLLLALPLSAAVNAQVTFFVSPGPDPTGDLAWQAAATASGSSLTEFDFEQYAPDEYVSMMGVPGLTVDMELLDINNVVEPNGPRVFNSPNYFTFPGVIWNSAILNGSNGSGGTSFVQAPRFRLSFSPPITGFGVWIYDDNSSANHQFVLLAETVSGQTIVSPVLDSAGPQGVDGFLGVTSSLGITSVVVEVQDTAGAPTSSTFFELDHVQVARGGGSSYCGPAVTNSSGQPAVIDASGSFAVANNDVTLTCRSMPASSFGFFLTSQSQGFVTNPGGSAGTLCLGGAIGRYVGPGQIQYSGTLGEISLVLDLTQHPTPTGPVGVQPGETWNFQAWFRDSSPSGATSNFSDGYSIPFL